MSASALLVLIVLLVLLVILVLLVVINDVFHKILKTHKGFLTETTHWKFLCFYNSVPPSVQSLQPFPNKILGQKEQGGIIKVMAVVAMVLNFLITDKSIMAEWSAVPSQVSKCSNISVF